MGTGSGPVWDGEKWVHPDADPQPAPKPRVTPPVGEPPATPPAGPRDFATRLRTAIGSHPLTSGAIALGIGALLAAGITTAITAPQISSASDQRDNLAAELRNTQASLEQAQTARDQAQQVASRIRSQRDQIISDAKAQATKMVNGAKQKLGDINGQIQQAQGDLTSTQSKLDSVNASLEQARATKQMSTFGDGTWSVGDDILAGTYRSSAGGGCYWEILKSPSGGGIYNIIDNGFGPNATISVSTGQWLRVQDCGTWSPGP